MPRDGQTPVFRPENILLLRRRNLSSAIAPAAKLEGSGTTTNALLTIPPSKESTVYPAGKLNTGPEVGKLKVWLKSAVASCKTSSA